MDRLPNGTSPAEAVAGVRKADFGLDNLGTGNIRRAYWNLSSEALTEEAIFRSEGSIAASGPLMVRTGAHTGRSANDKFVVRHVDSENQIWWGAYNRPIGEDKFAGVQRRMLEFMHDNEVFVQDVYAGADDHFRLPVRFVTEYAWHSHFIRNMFVVPGSEEEYRRFVPSFTVIALPSFKASAAIDDTNSETFILLSFEKRVVLIGNTAYAGEMKKSIFTVLNYLLPLQGVLPMHCSANVHMEDHDDVALFFGLSGTGKTTLSTDASRRLIGDDEHGWSDEGVFNFEGGCYAKVIGLSKSAEPQIYEAAHRFGTILENVPFDPLTRAVDLDDGSITENTRASYPLDFIDSAVPEKRAGHPRNIIFLTCDATGVMPPIARLSLNQALYQFISGYTSKIAGTEAGVGKEPVATFSACFGGPFLVHHPSRYAELLSHKLAQHGATCWLVNTGWVGGGYGVGKRISIGYTRALLRAALSGSLGSGQFRQDPVFGFEIPLACADVPSELLDPSASWPDRKAYDKSYRDLATRFVENFARFASGTPAEIADAGPRV